MDKRIEITREKLDKQAYKDFIYSFSTTPEQLANDTETPISGFSTDVRTGYAIVPDERLAEQGRLLWNFINSPENRPDDIGAETLKNALFDAAFKCDFWYGKTALHEAISEGDKETAASLIKTATPEQCFLQNDSGRTALHGATSKGDKETAALLIAKGSAKQCFLTDNHRRTAFYDARGEIADLFIEKASDDQHFLKTCFYEAVESWNTQAIDSIIEKVSSSAYRENFFENCGPELQICIHKAANCADHELKNFYNKTIDTIINNVSSVKEFLTPLRDGYNVVEKAVYDNNTEVALAIIEKATPEELFSCRCKGSNPLLNFVIHRDNKTLEAAIIAKGSAEQCFLQGENEETALHVAISNDRKETTDLLIAKGYAEQCFLQDEDGKTALHNTLCRYHRDENAASKLIEKGSADQCFLPDKDGKTALHDALDDDRNLEIVKLFLKKDKKKTIEILQSSDSKIAKEILEEIALKKFENGLSLFSSKPRQTSAPEEIQHTKEMSK